MHKTVAIISAALVMGQVSVGWASTNGVLPGMARKLVNGAIDTVTGVVEVPMQTVKGYKKGLSLIKHEPSSKAVGTVLGFFRGIGHGAGRTIYGAADVVTFWLPNRPDNQGIGIPLDAEYSWWQGEQYSIFKPTIKEGLMPYPRKIAHGLADGFLGIVELPGQIVKGATSEDGVLVGLPVGVVKGLWFGGARSAYGIGDAILFLVPNPAETEGYGYEEEWPWTALSESF